MSKKGKQEQPFKIDRKFRALIPPLAEAERAGLEASLLAEGCRDALVVWRGLLLDGHHRHQICTKHGIPFRTSEVNLPDRIAAKCWIVRNQFGRRNLTPFQRAELALQLEAFIAGEAKKRQGRRTDLSQNSAECCEPIDTRKELAKSAGVSHDTIAKVKYIEQRADEETKAQLRRADSGTSINAEYKKLRTEERREQRLSRNAEISAGNPEIEADMTPASVLLCDPPWKYEGAETDSRVIENQYPTMSLEEICELDIEPLCTPDVVLFLWTTSPKLEDSFRVLKAWGFKYRTCAVWDKEIIGMGYYFRQQHELLLVATKGALPVPKTGHRISSVIRSRRGKHSEKPATVLEFIETAYPDLAKRELFARKQRKEWLPGWGNQA